MSVLPAGDTQAAREGIPSGEEVRAHVVEGGCLGCGRGSAAVERGALVSEAEAIAAELEDDELREQALMDTGVMARNVLGLSYDQHWRTRAKVRPGGIRLDGPHREMVDFLDRPTLAKHLEAPRGSYKTSLLHAYVIRRVLQDPNVRVLYVMDTFDHAKKNISKLNEYFSNENGKLVELFGDLIEKGGTVEFTIKGRTDPALKEPTFSASGVDKNVTGGHYDIIILDDVVYHGNVQNAEQIEKTLEYFRTVQPLLDPGGTLIVVGTRWHDQDLYGYILGELKEDFDTLILDSGVELIREEGQKPRLEGTPRFAHQPIEFLESKLRLLEAPMFSSQYLNRCLAGASAEFKRTYFRSEPWAPWMAGLSAYMVTDTAVTSQEDGCLSVCGIVGLDANECAYLLDLHFGFWEPAQFVNTVVSTYLRWQSKVKLRGALFEHIAMNRTFRPGIEAAAREQNLRMHFIPVPRGLGEPSKEQRIKRLHPRFHEGRFFVVDTVPRYIELRGETKLLFDPYAHNGEPDGELVKQFIRFPLYRWNDIPDAIADIDARTSEGQRLCNGAALRDMEQAKSGGIGARRGRAVQLEQYGRADTLPIAGSGGLPNGDWYARAAQRASRGVG